MNDFTLADGLSINPVGPDWLTHIWPFTILNSSLMSIMTVLAIYVGLILFCIIFAFGSRSMPKVLNILVPVIAGAAAIFFALSGFLAYQSWSQPSAISDKAISKTANETAVWLSTKGVSASSQQVWDLTCEFYNWKNHYCTPNLEPTISNNGTSLRVRMLKHGDGTIVLMDTKNQNEIGAR